MSRDWQKSPSWARRLALALPPSFRHAEDVNHTTPPVTDPTPLFELFRGNHATELLVAAVAHFDVFARLSNGPKPFAELRAELGLSERAANVLFTALRAMGTLTLDASPRLALTPLAREHLVPGGVFYVGDYGGLAAQSPGVVAMAERLRSGRPKDAEKPGQGAAFIFREGVESAMEIEASARALTLALAGRAKNVAPLLAQNLPLPASRRLLDVGGGTGLYAIALLQANPELRATVLDRPEVLKVAAEFGAASGVMDRLTLLPGDMFTTPLPAADTVLLSNILHDWDVPECRALIGRCAAVLPAGGRLLIHDVFLADDLGGPLPLALYSAALFTLTEGRAYSAAEYRGWLRDAGLSAEGTIVSTLVHCGVLAGDKY
jgi:predicted O-methyltransferase YrrM